MKVLFVCKGNWYRSQIAAALYNQLTHGEEGSSAGTYVGAMDEPEGQSVSTLMPADFFETAEAHGLDLRTHRTRKLTPEMMESVDVVVSMAEEPYIPDFLRTNPKVVFWDVPDGKRAEAMYQKIASLVSGLVQ
mgnify:CR=1 FL=1